MTLKLRRFKTIPDDESELPRIGYECPCHANEFNSEEEAYKFHDDIKNKEKLNNVGQICPKCGDGHLRLFEGNFGRFIGCDAYSVNKCKYKIQV